MVPWLETLVTSALEQRSDFYFGDARVAWPDVLLV